VPGLTAGYEDASDRARDGAEGGKIVAAIGCRRGTGDQHARIRRVGADMARSGILGLFARRAPTGAHLTREGT
jgi:hypothetical protein